MIRFYCHSFKWSYIDARTRPGPRNCWLINAWHCCNPKHWIFWVCAATLIPKDCALRAPNFQGHPTASPATTARTAAKCHIRRPTAQHGGWRVWFYCKNCGCDLQTCTKDKSGGVGVQLLTTMLDVGNLNSDSQPVQKRFLGGPRKEKLRSFPHVEHSLIILSAMYSILVGLQVGSVMISFTHIGRKPARILEEPLKFRTNVLWWQLWYCLLLAFMHRTFQSIVQ